MNDGGQFVNFQKLKKLSICLTKNLKAIRKILEKYLKLLLFCCLLSADVKNNGKGVFWLKARVGICGFAVSKESKEKNIKAEISKAASC